MSDNITIIDGDGNTPVTFDIHLDNPYFTEVEQKAWTEGYTAARNDNITKEELENPDDFTNRTMNPYTSGDTTTAWVRGYDDFSYHPGTFSIDVMTTEQLRQTMVTVWRHLRVSGTSELRLLFSWPSWAIDGKPAWADNRAVDRSIPFDSHAFKNHVRSLVQYQNEDFFERESIELPCPTYEFSYDEGGMRISKGAFTKWGDKDAWQGVIDTMQEALDDMPATLDISGIEIEIEVTVSGTFTTSIGAATLLGSSEFHGDVNELEVELEGAINDVAGDYISLDYADPDLEIDGFNCLDLGYDIRNGVSEQ